MTHLGARRQHGCVLNLQLHPLILRVFRRCRFFTTRRVGQELPLLLLEESRLVTFRRVYVPETK